MKEAKSITLDDVGREAGVGKMTVSMILRGKPIRCKPETRQKVLQAAEKLNYKPSLAAKILYNKKSDTVGLLMPRLGMEVNMIEAEFSAVNLRLTASSFHNNVDTLSNMLEELKQRYADGVIVIDPVENCQALKDWHSEGLPIVLVSNSPEKYPDIDTFVNNTAGGVEDIITHLIDYGHRKIAGIFTSVDMVPNSISFWQGWEKALKTVGEKPDPEFYFPIIYSLEEPEAMIYEHAYKAAQDFLKRFKKSDPNRPTALFTMGDSITLPIVKAFQEAGWQIPDDISIASNYISEFGRYFPIPLTGVYQDRIELRAGAARFLAERIMNKENIEKKRKLVYSDQKLIIRNSTKPINQ